MRLCLKDRKPNGEEKKGEKGEEWLRLFVRIANPMEIEEKEKKNALVSGNCEIGKFKNRLGRGKHPI